MKIGLIHHQIIRGTAVETFLMEFAKKLAAEGHEPVYITTLTTPEIGASLPGRWELVPRLRGSGAARQWFFDRQAPQIARQAGVDFTIGFGRTTAQVVHRNGTGCHRLYGQFLPFWQRFSVRHLLELHLEKKLYGGARTKQFVTSSARVAAQLQGVYHTPGERFRILPLPVESQVFKPAENRPSQRELVCRKLQTDTSKPVLLFVSLSHRRRGLEPLLDALQTLDATLWIVGKGLAPDHLRQIAHLGIGGKIRNVPVTNQLVEIYQAADWFVHPTQYDAHSNTVLQSMACGLPGVVSVMDGAVDHIKNGENGFMLYHPQDATELATRIREALELDEAARMSMGACASESILSLTWDSHMAEWNSLIESARS